MMKKQGESVKFVKELEIKLGDVKMIELFWSEKLAQTVKKPFKDFSQRMANRLMQGDARYGAPRKDKNYMTRLIMEVKAYRKSGNQEHLINVANYCVLETIAPEHPKFHFDNTVESVTRK